MSSCDPDHVPKETRDFQANYSFAAVTEKFYARHECCYKPPPERIEHYFDMLQALDEYRASDHYAYPRYTNQHYGWFGCHKMKICKRTMTDEEIYEKCNIRPLREKDINCFLNYCNNKYARYREDRWKIV